MDPCVRTQQLIDALPFTTAGLVKDPPFTLSQATAAAQALDLFNTSPLVEDCWVRLPNKNPFGFSIPNPLRNTEQRGRLLLGILRYLEDSDSDTAAAYLFGPNLQVIEHGLRSEIEDDIRVGWLAAATMTNLAGIEDAVMDLAEIDWSERVRAAAILVLSNAPGATVRAYAARLRTIADATKDSMDSSVRSAGTKLLGWIQVQTAGDVAPATPGRVSRSTDSVDAGDVVLGVSLVGAALLGFATWRRRR